MDNAKISRLITELDKSVPKQGAQVRMEEYGGGPDESQFIANQTGYLRFGIEFLKAAIEKSRPSKSEKTLVNVDIEYLTSKDSYIQFDAFYRSESLTSDTDAQSSMGFYLSIAVFLVLGALVVIGARTVIGWLG